MDLVRQFSEEMNTVLDGKLPVSRAKMASITRIALKAVKYYKHIVMTVEKFLSKCPPEYKVPGLYVIDSIVRQSRHQFGNEKDNFGPRFSKNFEKTFLYLFVCPSEDKPKIIRVLNLWQKNGVFSPEVIQPLLALAPSPDESPQNPPETAATKQSTNKQSASKQSIIKESAHKQPPSADKTTTLDLETANAVIQRQHSQIQALLQQQQQASTLLGPALQGLLAKATDSDLVSLLKQSQELAAAKEAHNLMEASRANGEPPPAQMSNNRPIVSNRDQHGEFNTALLDDFDYSDDDEPNRKKRGPDANMEMMESNKDATDHLLEELQEQFMRQESAKAEPLQQQPPPNQLPPPVPQKPLPPPVLPPQHFHPSRAPPLPLGPSHHYPPPDMPFPPQMMGGPVRPPLPPIDYDHRGPPPPSHPSRYPPPPPHHLQRSPPSPFGGPGRRGYRSPPGGLMRGRRRSPSPIRRHSGSWRDRSRDRDIRSSWRRSRSPSHRDRTESRRSRSPYRDRAESRRSRSPSYRDRNESRSKASPHRSPRRRSEDNDRQRRGGTLHKEKHVTVLSTTIWMGHLAKSTTKEQITEACSNYGQVHSVDVVSARGCAYVVMGCRPDAMRVLNGLKDVRLNGSICKLAWAPGRGVKGGAYRDFWNLDDGVSIIPWDSVSSQDKLNKFADGGWVEPDTCPPGMNPPPPPEPVREEVSQPPLFTPSGMPPLFTTPQGVPLPPQGPAGLPTPLFQSPPFPANNALPQTSSNDATVDMQIASPPPPEL